MKRLTFPLAAVAALIVGTAGSAAAANAPQPHVRGTITAVSPTKLTVLTASGPVDVPISATTHVVGVVPASTAEITSGTFIGTANVAGPTAARALEVVVFPKAMAGTGEGDYPWDLPAGNQHASMMTNGTVGGRGGGSMMTNGTVGGHGGGSMMTNGTVGAHGGGSMMTNATVTGVKDGAAKTVTLHYKGGTKVVTIPADAPIVRIVPGTSSLLKNGAHVVAFPAAGGASAKSVVVGEKGAVPPM